MLILTSSERTPHVHRTLDTSKVVLYRLSPHTSSNTPPPPYLSRCPSFYKLPSDAPPPYPYSDAKHPACFGQADADELARKLSQLTMVAPTPMPSTCPTRPTVAPRRPKPRSLRVCNPDLA
ncbi:hypothetical protein DACRYDRAFT_108500 [Dacryopinax primogenitus]|uniref:Uncharacterized protein n=1 Tax=Dacryopinax primogenitus (strain DJM 731) TaxID=1858805 RepID=M5FXG7_DACPD|nr:uncharacterized protein DACRYDRAFT_108500 [Dacryopinax primogenitus]EJU01169.1 hypothetical protein DACRYDRAFT_108500 [Dacryopinax primogenitus]